MRSIKLPPESVYIGFPLFVLPEAHAEGHSSIVWGVREFVFLLGEQSGRRRPVPPVSARPRRPAVRRPVPTRPGYVRVLDSTGYIYIYIYVLFIVCLIFVILRLLLFNYYSSDVLFRMFFLVYFFVINFIIVSVCLDLLTLFGGLLKNIIYIYICIQCLFFFKNCGIYYFLKNYFILFYKYNF